MPPRDWLSWSDISYLIPKCFQDPLHEVVEHYQVSQNVFLGHANTASSVLGIFDKDFLEFLLRQAYGKYEREFKGDFTWLIENDPTRDKNQQEDVHINLEFVVKFLPHFDTLLRELITPIRQSGNQIIFASADPFNRDTEKTIRHLCELSNIEYKKENIKVYLAPVHRIIDFLSCIRFIFTLGLHNHFKFPDTFQNISIKHQELRAGLESNDISYIQLGKQIDGELLKLISESIAFGGNRLCIGILNFLKICLSTYQNEDTTREFKEFIDSLLLFLTHNFRYIRPYNPYISSLSDFYLVNQNLPPTLLNNYLLKKLNELDNIINQDFKTYENKYIKPKLTEPQDLNKKIVIFGFSSIIMRKLFNHFSTRKPEHIVLVHQHEYPKVSDIFQIPYLWRSQLLIEILNKAYSYYQCTPIFNNIDNCVAYLGNSKASVIEVHTSAEHSILPRYFKRNEPYKQNEVLYCCEKNFMNFIDKLKRTFPKDQPIYIYAPFLGNSKLIYESMSEIESFIPAVIYLFPQYKSYIERNSRELVPERYFS